MSCECISKLDRFVDGELPEGESREVEAHLRGCPTCATDALSRLQLKRMTQAAGRRYSPSREFRLMVEKSIGTARRPGWTWHWVSVSAAAAALALLVISAAAWLQHSRGEQTLTEIADLHVAMLASSHPVEVTSSDRHTVKPWFQGKIPFSFNLPELQGSAFVLLGGRLTYLQRFPGAHLLFEIRKHQISVFIFQDESQLGRSLVSARGKLGLNIETWAEGGLRYIVIGDAAPSDIHELSERLKTAARS